MPEKHLPVVWEFSAPKATGLLCSNLTGADTLHAAYL